MKPQRHPVPTPVAAPSAGPAPGLVLGAAALTMGLLAGFIYAYSVSVMPGLGQADDRTLVDGMQQINEATENPAFFLSFLELRSSIVAALVLAYRSGSRQVVRWLVAALVLCAVEILVTGAANIPLNDDLKQAGDPDRIAEHRPGARRLLRPLGRLEHRPDRGLDRRLRLPRLRPDAPWTAGHRLPTTMSRYLPMEGVITIATRPSASGPIAGR